MEAQGYTVVVLKSGASVESLKHAAEGSAMRRYYDNVMTANPGYHFVDTFELGLERIDAEPETLLFGSSLGYFVDTKHVPLRTTDGLTSYVSWAFQKDSEFTEFFNHHLQVAFEQAAADRLFRRWTYMALEEFGVEDAIALGYIHTLFPFSVLGLGLIASVITAAAERFVNIRLLK